ncbi:mitochondrial carrier domain-containing protein [Syncephalis plumigaleata]|nr:mitochondrial carrier domain-containing protein [Syncephalis plumigaleata]
MAQVVVGQPLDTVKVRLQVENAAKGQFKGPWHCMVDTVRREGFLALYKGMAAPLVGISAVNALLFTAYSSLKDVQVKWFNLKSTDQLSAWQLASAGAGAGFVNTILASPVEMLKVRLQVQRSMAGFTTTTQHVVSQYHHGPIDLARSVIVKDGWRHGLMRGFWATAAREIPAYAAFYTSFEVVKRQCLLQRHRDVSTTTATTTLNTDDNSVEIIQPALWQLMLAGSTAGISCWCACYPLDVIKSRAQNSRHRLSSNYIMEIARDIYRSEGIMGFWRGFTPCVLRSIPAAAATFTTYELVMQALH